MATTRSARAYVAALTVLTAMALVIAMLPGGTARAQTGPDVNILRADYFTNYAGTFVNIEAKVDVDDPEVAEDLTVTATWGGQTIELNDFEDADVYMYHRTSSPVLATSPPAGQTVTVSVEGGGSESQEFREWIPGSATGTDDDRGRPYQEGFVTEYLDAVEITERIEALAAEFPDLAEIVELPYETNGYRRKAQALLWTDADEDGNVDEEDEEDGEVDEESGAFYATTHAWGHEGGNDWTLTTVAADEANAPLTVDVGDDTITVTLATDADGAVTSTAADVVAALNEEADEVVWAATFRGDEGDGIAPVGTQQFSDFLSAPDHISHEPATVKMIRIGKHRDGSKVGVFAYAQEHAREWQTPLMALETAERLLRNYRTDAETRRLVNGLDIFIIPTVNPDGTNYSIYDFAFQRKNMTNYCGPEQGDPLRRNSWGVDLNRNHSVGSAYDGYDGASTTNCLSGTYAGPAEHSEPEARNLDWVAQTFDNIKYSMNIHSHGGYFMWSPGAYIEEGRIPLERPSLGVEDYFFEASERVLGAIKEHRGTVIWPGRTGPTSDVLYSAAGNSADEMYYLYDIIAWNFELGASIWDAEDERWRTPQAEPGQASGFQPAMPEGVEQALEFSNGLIEMMQVALDYSKDRRAPRADLVVTDSGGGTVDFTFTSDEPATIYYTTDGSRPDYDSEVLEAEYIRDEAETITVSEGTTVNWFAVDIAGNVSRRYDPAGRARNYSSERVRP